MRAGPRINVDVYVIYFNLQRRKIYSATEALLLGRIPQMKIQKSLTWGGGHQCLTQISLHTGPMLKIPQATNPTSSPGYSDYLHIISNRLG
jgi:hypothetical protein